MQASVKKRDVVLGEVVRNQQKLEKLQKRERTGQVVVVYHVPVVASKHVLLKKFRPIIIGCVLRTYLQQRTQTCVFDNAACYR